MAAQVAPEVMVNQLQILESLTRLVAVLEKAHLAVQVAVAEQIVVEVVVVTLQVSVVVVAVAAEAALVQVA
jgi:hypothetical protein